MVVISMHDSRYPHAASRRMRALTDELGRRGMSFVELAPHPSAADLGDDGVARIHAPGFLTGLMDNSRSLPARSVGEWIYAAWAARTARALNPDAVLVTVPPVPLLATSWFLGALRPSTRTVVEFRDLTWEYARARAASQPGLRSRVVRCITDFVASSYERLARAAVVRADVSIVTTSTQAKRLRQLHAGGAVQIIRNGVAQDLLDLLWPMTQTPHNGDRVRILYAGNLGHTQDVEQLLQVANLAPSIDLSIVGSGPCYAQIEAAAARLDNVTVEQTLPFEALVARYHSADVLIACLRQGDEFETAVPSKLYEYAASGRVVAFIGPEEAQSVCESLGGLASDTVTRSFVDTLILHSKERRAQPLTVRPAALVSREQSASATVDHLIG